MKKSLACIDAWLWREIGRPAPHHKSVNKDKKGNMGKRFGGNQCFEICGQMFCSPYHFLSWFNAVFVFIDCNTIQVLKINWHKLNEAIYWEVKQCSLYFTKRSTFKWNPSWKELITSAGTSMGRTFGREVWMIVIKFQMWNLTSKS